MLSRTREEWLIMKLSRYAVGVVTSLTLSAAAVVSGQGDVFASPPTHEGANVAKVSEVHDRAPLAQARRGPARRLLSKLGQHFPEGQCKHAVSQLRRHFDYADAPRSDQDTDGITSAGDFLSMDNMGDAATKLVLTRAHIISVLHDISPRAAVVRAWQEDNKLQMRINMARMARYFFIDDTQHVSHEFRSMETAYHHNAPDDKASWGDTDSYLRQDECVRG